MVNAIKIKRLALKDKISVYRTYFVRSSIICAQPRLVTLMHPHEQMWMVGALDEVLAIIDVFMTYIALVILAKFARPLF